VSSAPQDIPQPSVETSQPPFASDPLSPIFSQRSLSSLRNPPPTVPQPQIQRSTTPPFSPRQKAPDTAAIAKTEHEELVKQLSRILFTQPKGILESFIDYSLGNILRPLFDQHQKEVHDAALGKSTLLLHFHF
jgi:hypothetical protein